MFYSSDLLGKRSPLGAVWCAGWEGEGVGRPGSGRSWGRGRERERAKGREGERGLHSSLNLTPPPTSPLPFSLSRMTAHGKRLPKKNILSVSVVDTW
jgi:hypothetical protein